MGSCMSFLPRPQNTHTNPFALARSTVTELENNMIESHETTKAAVADLEEAAKYQRSSQCLIQ